MRRHGRVEGCGVQSPPAGSGAGVRRRAECMSGRDIVRSAAAALACVRHCRRGRAVGASL